MIDAKCYYFTGFPHHKGRGVRNVDKGICSRLYKDHLLVGRSIEPKFLVGDIWFKVEATLLLSHLRIAFNKTSVCKFEV